MVTIAIPNISTSDPHKLTVSREAVKAAGAAVLDVHSDNVHNRSVLTVWGTPSSMAEAMAALAAVMASVDLRAHRGVHPRLGGLDVCPFVPHESAMQEAVALAHETGKEIALRCGLPVYFYGLAALRPETSELPALRRGGLNALRARALSGLAPDEGPATIDPRTGVVCVGARRTLIAFNVWLDCDAATARRIATKARASGGGLTGVRALGWSIRSRPPRAQVSLNLTDPQHTGIDAAFKMIEGLAWELGAAVVATELVGLVPERHLPDPGAPAARLLLTPARKLEDFLPA